MFTTEEMLNCTVITEESVLCNGTVYVLPERKLSYENKWFWIYLAIYVALVLMAGLVSGLTMGLLSLDMMTLKILKEGGTAREKKYAARILPVVKRHHLLLVTLLLANAAAVEAMPIFLDRISDPIIAISVSVSAVLLFGEVFPQALCTRFGLAIGATLTPFVYFLMGLVFVIAFPLSKLLDCLLGKDHDTFYRRAQLKVLVDLHGPSQEAVVEDSPNTGQDHLTVDEVLIIKGALDMKDKVVEDAMLPLQDVYMLDVGSKLDKDTMDSVLATAHSRIPIYSETQHNIIGLILVKMLIKLDPEDATPLEEVITDPNCFRKVPTVYHDMALFDLLNMFQTGKSHLCLVRRRLTPQGEHLRVNAAAEDVHANDTDGELMGIITLEDVIEELIQEEIVDETDVFVDVQRRIRVARAKASRQISSSSQHRGSEVYNQCELYSPARQLSDEPLVDISGEATAPLLSNQELA